MRPAPSPDKQQPGTPVAPRRWPLRATDVQGLARLGVDGTLGVTHLVEAMHQAVLSGGGLLNRRAADPADASRVDDPAWGPAGDTTGGLTGGVYRAVRGTTRAVGWGVNGLLGLLARPAPLPDGLGDAGGADNTPSSPEREALLAVLNGVLGDHLAATANPLAIAPGWRVDGLPWSADADAGANSANAANAGTARRPQPTGRVLVLVHGLCMNDLQFSRDGHNHGAALQASHGCTPVYWHYNSGRHVADNGALLSEGLERLLARWPVPVRELVLLGHSMGGLVLRSACHQAGLAQAPWLARVSHLFCLGTPHHGAPLERGGHLLDRALGLSPWVAPLARVGQVRSAGITDLRYGNVQPGDGRGPASGGSRHGQRLDDRQPTPLPEHVFCGLVAATLSARASGLRSATLGDGLVPLASALGRHRRPTLALKVPAARQQLLTHASHWDLLSRPEVAQQLGAWLDQRGGVAPAVRPPRAA